MGGDWGVWGWGLAVASAVFSKVESFFWLWGRGTEYGADGRVCLLRMEMTGISYLPISDKSGEAVLHRWKCIPDRGLRKGKDASGAVPSAKVEAKFFC